MLGIFICPTLKGFRCGISHAIVVITHTHTLSLPGINSDDSLSRNLQLLQTFVCDQYFFTTYCNCYVPVMHTVNFDCLLTTMIRILFMECTSPLKSMYNYTISMHRKEITAKSAHSSLVPSPHTPPAKVRSGDKTR